MKDSLWGKFLYHVWYPANRWVKDTYWRIRNLPYYFSKVWDYAKILWDDADFDMCHLLPLIELKTRRVREHLTKEGLVYVDERKMKEVEYLAKRLREDNYCSKEWDEYLDKFPLRRNGKIRFAEQVDSKEAGEILTRICKQQTRMIEAESDRLFVLLRKYYQVWWS